MSRSNSPKLSRAGSHSSLWRSWSPMLDGLTNYDKSRRNYPWLANDDMEEGLYETQTSRHSRRLSLLAEVPDTVSQSDRSIKSTDDLEEQSAPGPLLEPQDGDPNLVSSIQVLAHVSLTYANTARSPGTVFKTLVTPTIGVSTRNGSPLFLSLVSPSSLLCLRQCWLPLYRIWQPSSRPRQILRHTYSCQSFFWHTQSVHSYWPRCLRCLAELLFFSQQTCFTWYSIPCVDFLRQNSKCWSFAF